MSIAEPIRLTLHSHGGGCACKLPAAELARVLRDLPGLADPRVLAGNEGFEDACAYLVAPGLAVVQSVDFFTPIVDEPRSFGRIAAANALSDVYAMGARPAFALALAAWPQALDHALLAEVLAGGAEKAAEAGCVIVGGHTIDDPEPKYGLAATGLADPDALWRNSTGQPGDVLFLTKPIGTAIVAHAIKGQQAPADVAAAAVASMERLNAAAADAVREAGGPSAVTDVTGFGLVGHARELASASGLTARIEVGALPLLPGVRELAEAGHSPGGSRRNLAAADAYARFAGALSEVDRLLACDAQTSGGLLVAIPVERAAALAACLAARGLPAAPIGSLERGDSGRVLVS